MSNTIDIVIDITESDDFFSIDDWADDYRIIKDGIQITMRKNQLLSLVKEANEYFEE